MDSDTPLQVSERERRVNGIELKLIERNEIYLRKSQELFFNVMFYKIFSTKSLNSDTRVCVCMSVCKCELTFTYIHMIKEKMVIFYFTGTHVSTLTHIEINT